MKFLVSRKKLEVEENDGKKKEYTDRQTDRSDCIETPLLVVFCMLKNQTDYRLDGRTWSNA